MKEDILKEYDDSKETVLSRFQQLETLKFDSKGRVNAIQKFIGSMDDFLTDTKSKLCKMVASFNDIESERR